MRTRGRVVRELWAARDMFTHTHAHARPCLDSHARACHTLTHTKGHALTHAQTIGRVPSVSMCRNVLATRSAGIYISNTQSAACKFLSLCSQLAVSCTNRRSHACGRGFAFVECPSLSAQHAKTSWLRLTLCRQGRPSAQLVPN